jgi:hypothetical protein
VPWQSRHRRHANNGCGDWRLAKGWVGDRTYHRRREDRRARHGIAGHRALPMTIVYLTPVYASESLSVREGPLKYARRRPVA